MLIISYIGTYYVEPKLSFTFFAHFKVNFVIPFYFILIN